MFWWHRTLSSFYYTFTLHFIALPFMLRSIVHVQSIFVRAMRPAASTVSDIRSSRLHLLKRLPSPPERICSFVEDWLAGAAGMLGSGPSTCVLSRRRRPGPAAPSSARVQPCVPSRRVGGSAPHSAHTRCYCQYHKTAGRDFE